MSEQSSQPQTSLYKRGWLLWDKAWDLDISQEQRIAALKEATDPSFVWCNATHKVVNGDYVELAQIIEQLLQQAGNKLTVKWLGWWEHHGQAALQWDMVHVDTGARLTSGVSHGTYNEHGKLLSVSDFY